MECLPLENGFMGCEHKIDLELFSRIERLASSIKQIMEMKQCVK